MRLRHPQQQTDTGKDGDLVEGSSKETTNEPMNANIQEEESRYAADCASQGRQVGPCGFSGKACKFPLLAARKCLDCEVSYHELCAHAANTEGVIKEYKDGCPTCHMARALGGWGRERGEGARMDFFSLPIRKKGGRG